MTWGPRAGRSWQRTQRNRFGVCFPGLFACGFCLCALSARSLVSALGPGQSPAGEAEERKPSSHRLANGKREYKCGHRRKQQEKEIESQDSGALVLLAEWGGSGVCPARWKAEGEVSSGVGGGWGEAGKRKIRRPSLSLRSVRVYPACPPRQAAPAAKGGGAGRRWFKRCPGTGAARGAVGYRQPRPCSLRVLLRERGRPRPPPTPPITVAARFRSPRPGRGARLWVRRGRVPLRCSGGRRVPAPAPGGSCPLPCVPCTVLSPLPSVVRAGAALWGARPASGGPGDSVAPPAGGGEGEDEGAERAHRVLPVRRLLHRRHHHHRVPAHV